MLLEQLLYFKKLKKNNFSNLIINFELNEEVNMFQKFKIAHASMHPNNVIKHFTSTLTKSSTNLNAF